MNQFSILFIRIIVGAAIAVMMWRGFFPNKEIVYVVALAVFLIGMSYVTEYLRKRKRNGSD